MQYFPLCWKRSKNKSIKWKYLKVVLQYFYTPPHIGLGAQCSVQGGPFEKVCYSRKSVGLLGMKFCLSNATISGVSDMKESGEGKKMQIYPNLWTPL